MARENYERQVQLLVRTLPFVARQDVFALKGGTAINLFCHDIPRLSVDIDLVYLPVEDRTASLAGIDGALEAIQAAVGPVEGGPQAVAQALLDAVSPGGSLLAYVSWQDSPYERTSGGNQLTEDEKAAWPIC